MTITLEKSSVCHSTIPPSMEEFFTQAHGFLASFHDSMKKGDEISIELILRQCLHPFGSNYRLIFPIPDAIIALSPSSIDFNNQFFDFVTLYNRHKEKLPAEMQESFESLIQNLTLPFQKIENFLAKIERLSYESSLKNLIGALKSLLILARDLDPKKDTHETLFPLLRLIEERSYHLVFEKMHAIQRLFFHFERLESSETHLLSRFIKSLENTLEDLLFFKTVKETLLIEFALIRLKESPKKPKEAKFSLSVLCSNSSSEELSDEETLAFEHLGGLIKGFGTKRIQELAEELTIDDETWQKGFRDRAILSHLSCLDVMKTQETASWVTGTSSHTIVGMYLSQIKGFTKELALIPSGALLSQNLVPLSGELGFGILSKKGVNQNHLSGCAIDAYHHAFSYAFSSEFYFDPSKAITKFQEALELLPASFSESDDIAVLNAVKIPLLRALDYTPLFKEEIESMRLKINTWQNSDGIDPKRQDEIKAFFSFVFEDRKPVEFPSLVEQILKKPSFPLAFASAALLEDELIPIRSSVTSELVFRGIMPLKEKITLAITIDEEVELLRRILPIPVIDFKSAEFLFND
jgi:hypothetical protein